MYAAAGREPGDRDKPMRPILHAYDKKGGKLLRVWDPLALPGGPPPAGPEAPPEVPGPDPAARPFMLQAERLLITEPGGTALYEGAKPK